MGLQEELGYDAGSANAVQHLMQRVASSRPGSWLFQKLLYRVDRPIFTWSRGRITVPSVVAGLPVIMLTTTGAKSGQERTMPLVGIPVGGDLAIIGSNYGQTATPGWVYNLEAQPSARVAHGESAIDVIARRATDEETDRIFDLAADVYGGYAKYRSRADHRTIKVFVLTPAAPAR